MDAEAGQHRQRSRQPRQVGVVQRRAAQRVHLLVQHLVDLLEEVAFAGDEVELGELQLFSAPHHPMEKDAVHRTQHSVAELVGGRSGDRRRGREGLRQLDRKSRARTVAELHPLQRAGGQRAPQLLVPVVVRDRGDPEPAGTGDIAARVVADVNHLPREDFFRRQDVFEKAAGALADEQVRRGIEAVRPRHAMRREERPQLVPAQVHIGGDDDPQTGVLGLRHQLTQRRIGGQRAGSPSAARSRGPGRSRRRSAGGRSASASTSAMSSSCRHSASSP